MKKSEEIIVGCEHEGSYIPVNEVLRLIRIAQLDAIEETVKLCAENAIVKLHKSGKQVEIETPILKEQFYEKGNGDLVSQGFAKVGFNRKLCYENEIYAVDKQSVLNCAEILKQEVE